MIRRGREDPKLFFFPFSSRFRGRKVWHFGNASEQGRKEEEEKFVVDAASFRSFRSGPARPNSTKTPIFP